MYKVGDEVIIKENFCDLRYEDDPHIDPKMEEYAGQPAVILDVVHSEGDVRWYKITGNFYWWDERWLDEVSGTEIKDFTEDEFCDLFR